MKMRKFFFTAALALLAVGCSKSHDSLESKMYVCVTDYIKADGSADVADAIQDIIDKNPNRTIFFPDGTYVLSHSICTPADPTKSVHLELANFAILKAHKQFEPGTALVRLGGKDPYNTIEIVGSNYGINGGIFDGHGVADGISIDSGRETRITNASIKNTQVGIHILYGANSGSSDSDICDVNIIGNDDPNSIGLLVEGYDNTFTNMRIAHVNTGVWLKTGGNSLKNIHPLYKYSDNKKYEDGAGFRIEQGNNWCYYCYSDQFCTGFKLSKNVRVNLTDCFTFWYTAKGDSQTAIACDGTLESFVRGLHAGFRGDCPVCNLLTGKPGGSGVISDLCMGNITLSPADVSKYYIK